MRNGAISLESVLATEHLSKRLPRARDLVAENECLHALARTLVEGPEALLSTLVTAALRLCPAETAGVSLLDTSVDPPQEFRWAAVAGWLKAYEGAAMPADFSPCGVCLRRGTPLLSTGQAVTSLISTMRLRLWVKRS